MADKDTELLLSGKTSFKIEVPYKVLESGEKGARKPMIVYLHGYGQTIETFSKLCGPLFTLNAYHLFIQAPFPLYDRKRDKNRKVSEWGRAWYLYDGDQTQFLRSMHNASRFIREIITRVGEALPVSRLCLLGYSMGGYLAGYHAIHTPEQVNELVICGARFKSELLKDGVEKIFHQNILALHGNDDNNVEPGPQQDEISGLRDQGMDATFMMVDASHAYSETFSKKILEWLSDKGYT